MVCRKIRPVLINTMATEIALSDLAQLKIENFSDIAIEKEIGAGSFAKVCVCACDNFLVLACAARCGAFIAWVFLLLLLLLISHFHTGMQCVI